MFTYFKIRYGLNDSLCCGWWAAQWCDRQQEGSGFDYQAWGLYGWSLRVLLMSAWVLSRFSSYLPQSKNMHTVNCLKHMNVSVFFSVCGPVTAWRPVQAPSPCCTESSVERQRRQQKVDFLVFNNMVTEYHHQWAVSFLTYFKCELSLSGSDCFIKKKKNFYSQETSKPEKLLFPVVLTWPHLTLFPLRDVSMMSYWKTPKTWQVPFVSGCLLSLHLMSHHWISEHGPLSLSAGPSQHQHPLSWQVCPSPVTSTVSNGMNGRKLHPKCYKNLDNKKCWIRGHFKGTEVFSLRHV